METATPRRKVKLTVNSSARVVAALGRVYTPTPTTQIPDQPGEDHRAGDRADGSATVMDRPPSSRGRAVAVPPWTAAIDDTMVRPSPKPSWEVRALSRWKGWKIRSASAGLITGPVFATVR